MNEAPKAMSSKRNIIILVIVLAIVIVGGIIAAVAVGTSEKTDIAETLTLAERYLDEKNYEQAIIEFERILEIDPMNVDAYIGKAKALITLGNEDAAKSLLEDAYELTGSEDIKAMLDGISTPVNTTSATTTTSAEETEPEEPVYNHEYALAIEQMLYDHINNGGDLDTEMLEDVTAIGIYGGKVIHVSCGNRIGSDEKIYLNSLNIFTVEYPDGTSQEYTQSSVQNYDFLEYMTNLKHLSISYCALEKIPDISGLRKLHSANFSNNYISDLSGLTAHPSVYMLNLDFNHISDISVLNTIPQLRQVWLSNNLISELPQLSVLKDLNTLDLSCNYITDISPLSECTSMKSLSLGNMMSSIISHELESAMGTEYDVEVYNRFFHEHNRISDITPLANMVNLEQLHLDYNTVSDISVLSEISKLKHLDLIGNPINEAHLNALQVKHPDCNILY